MMMLRRKFRHLRLWFKGWHRCDGEHRCWYNPKLPGECCLGFVDAAN